MKKKILIPFICFISICFVSLIALTVTKIAEANETIDNGVSFEKRNYKDKYAIGEILNIYKISVTEDDSEISFYAELEKDFTVLKTFTFENGDESYTLNEEGDYTLTYIAYDSYNKIHTSSYAFKVGNYEYISISYNDSYSFSEFVSTKAYAYTTNGKVLANAIVTSPSGKNVDISSGGFYPSEEGTYTIKYTAGSTQETYYIEAVNKGITDLFIPVEGVKSIDSNISAPSYAQAGTGVRILSTGNEESTTVRYKNVIDLSKLDKDTNLIKVLTLSTEDYTLTSGLHIRLVDIYDEDNTVEYYAYPMYYPYYPGKPDWSHCFAIYDGRTLARNNDGDGNVRTNYGSAIPTHFNGQMLDGTMRSNVYWIELQFDYKESQCLALAYVVNPTQYCILDLDDPTQVGIGKEWGGFTTGEVYLEISFTTEGNNSGVLISEICGQSFSGSDIYDTSEPSILIHEYDETPSGCVGIPYDIMMPYRALDLYDGELNLDDVSIALEKQVIFDYYEDASDLINGSQFTPDTVGKYRLVYTIYDKNGNKGTKYLYIDVTDDASFYVVLDYEDNYYVGEDILISDVTAECYTYITDKKVEFYFNNNKLDVSLYGTVSFDTVGTFKIVYEFTAYGGKKLSGEKEISITLSDKPIIKEEAYNRYIATGKTLYLPLFDAVNYADSSDKYPEKYYMVNGVKVDYNTRSYTVSETAGTILNVDLCAGNAKKTISIEVINPLYLSDYFVTTSDTECTNGKNYLEYTFDSVNTFTFVNPLVCTSSNGMTIDIGLDSSLNKNDYFDVMVTDMNNANESIFIRVSIENGAYYLQLNAKGTKYPAKTAIKAGSSYVDLIINNVTYMIGSVCSIKEYTNGTEFKGFSSGLVYLVISFDHVSDTTGLCVYNINSKPFESYFKDDVLQVYEDISMPSIVYSSSIYDQTIAYGKEIILPSAMAWGVLSGRYSVSVTLRSPSNRNTIYQADASLNQSYTLDEYGTWYVQYTVVSASGLKKNFTTTILASNDNVPVYSVLNVPKESYKLNDTVSIPTVKSDENITVSVILITSNGKYNYLEQGSSYKLTLRGKYRILISINNGYHYTEEFYEFEVK